MFEIETRPDARAFRFAATLEHLDRAVAEAITFLRDREATGSLFEVKLLLREALLNAVLHGSRRDPRNQVTLTVLAGDGRLTFSVADQGPGFDWRARLTQPAPPEAENGRGLTIMSLYADDVRYNAEGSQVTLTKTVKGLRGPAAPDGTGEHTTRSATMQDIRFEDGRTILCPAGDIVASMTDGLRTRLKTILAEHPGPLVIDLAQVELIDSVGLGLLIAAHNTLAKVGEGLALTNVNADLATLLRTMRLDKHFSIQTA